MCDISFNVLILSTILVVMCDISFNVLMCNTSICCTLCGLLARPISPTKIAEIFRGLALQIYTNMYIYIYICIYIYIYICIEIYRYVYIYIYRERDRCIYIYIYMYRERDYLILPYNTLDCMFSGVLPLSGRGAPTL